MRTEPAAGVVPCSSASIETTAPRVAGLVGAPPARMPLDEREQGNRVPWPDSAQRLAAAREDGRHDELQARVPERSGRVEGAAETLARGLAGLPEPLLLVEIVDGDEPALSAGVGHHPVVAPGSDSRIVGCLHGEAPAVGQGVDHGAGLDVAREIPHAQTISGRSVFRANEEAALDELLVALEAPVLVLDRDPAVVADRVERGHEPRPVHFSEPGQSRHLPADPDGEGAVAVEPVSPDFQILRMHVEDPVGEVVDRPLAVDHQPHEVRGVEVQPEVRVRDRRRTSAPRSPATTRGCSRLATRPR